jgi:pimeloyl-ACP methyl ester carboxylesterase
MIRALRFAWAWKTGGTGLREEEVEIQRTDGSVPGTLLRPRGSRKTRPAWVVLHGITRPGRHHPTLLPFVHSLASSGAVVLVPEIPEWRELSFAPEAATDTVRAAILHLAQEGEVRSGHMGIMGFSFGVTQALQAGADPEIQEHLGCIAGFGGYHDFQATLRFQFLEEHSWKGEVFRLTPDPYGRWVVGGNLLPNTPGYQGTEAVVEALLTLAREAGEAKWGTREEDYDPRKDELEKGLPPEERALYRTFAPPTGKSPPRELGQALAQALAQQGMQSHPQLDPLPFLPHISLPVRLVHGREDRLIPFSETLRLAAAFPLEADVRTYLTGLFAHSRRDEERPSGGHLREQLRFLGMLADLLGLL